MVCGLLYGIGAELVTNLIVQPLGAKHIRGRFKLNVMSLGILVHVFLIGLPIASNAKLSRSSAQALRSIAYPADDQQSKTSDIDALKRQGRFQRQLDTMGILAFLARNA